MFKPKKLAIFKHLTIMGCCLLSERILAIRKQNFSSCSNKGAGLLNDTPTSSPSPLVEMAMSWVCHFSVLTVWCSIHRKGYIMLHLVAGVPIQTLRLSFDMETLRT